MHPFLIDIRNADVYLTGSKVLSSISWTMRENENWAIIGNNGSGKTTFMKLVFGEIIPAWGGTVHWFGRRTLEPLFDVQQRVGFVSADYQEKYSPWVLGWEVVASGFFSSIGVYEHISRARKKTALEWMEFLGICHLTNTPLGKMSYGESRRVLLARALVNRPALLILDEPCSGLDIPTRELFLEMLKKLAETGTRFIYVTHHIEEIMPFITHVAFLRQGQILSQGKKEDMLENRVLSKALECRLTVEKKSGRYWLVGSRLKKSAP